MVKLPVDSYETQIVTALLQKRSLILSASTGTGKSTRVPQFLLKGLKGKILLLEPRRVAARSIATRIASEMGVALGGKEVGYQIRFENRATPDTRLKIITEGILLQMLQTNPDLKGVEAVILDEFHERNVFTDLGLACCREIQKNFNPDLKILVMSATLDSPKVAEFLEADILDIPGTQFPVEIVYAGAPDKRSQTQFLEHKICERLKTVLAASTEGDVLIFLPGWGEIERSFDACQKLTEVYKCRFLKLHSSLDTAEQDLIFKDLGQRKVIFSTNIAETSLTLPGIKFVIDSGLEKLADFDVDLGVSKLKTERISLFSAKQRTGRAGRVSSGKCYRLWSTGEEEQMNLETPAQIKNSDLSAVLLQLMNWRGPLNDFQWFENPPKHNFSKAMEFLEDLEFVHKGEITQSARKILSLSISLRLRKLFLIPLRAEAINDLKRFVADSEKIPISEVAKLFERHAQVSAQGYTLPEALLFCFPDRVARVVESGRIQLVHEISLDKSPQLALKTGVLLVAFSVEFHKRAAHWDRKLKDFVPIELKDLEKVFPSELKKQKRSFWDDDRKKVRVIESLFFKDLALEAGKEIEADLNEKNEALAKYLQKNMEQLRQKHESLNRYFQRIEFMVHWAPDVFNFDFDGENFFEHLQLFMGEFKRADDVNDAKLLEIVRAFLPPAAQARLSKEAPDEIVLSSRPKPFQLRYEAFDRVVVSGRIREFTGVTQLPPLAGGKVKILAELLAPNYRPVQITSDLEGFWIRTYPEVKKELKSRYPKHFKD